MLDAELMEKFALDFHTMADFPRYCVQSTVTIHQDFGDKPQHTNPHSLSNKIDKLEQQIEMLQSELQMQEASAFLLWSMDMYIHCRHWGFAAL